MTPKKRLVMDVDYFDLGWDGWTRDRVEGLFENSARAGFTDFFWSVMSMGTAEYHSKIMPLYDGRDRRVGSKRLAEFIRAWDGLAEGVRLGKKYGIRIIPYFRMFDDYWPGMIDEVIDKIPHGWWESRCGNFQLKGWPCYSEPEVFDYKMRILKEIAGYGVDGIMFGCTRSHSLYVQPYRQKNFFGWNPSIASEYQRRYGVDIRKFDYIDNGATSEGHFAKKDIMFVHEYEYVGAEPVDLKAWHDIKGEGTVNFIREARKVMGLKAHFAMEASRWACSPLVDPDDDFPAKQIFYPADLVREGVINEWVCSENWRGAGLNFVKQVLPEFQGVLDAGGQINAWLNDVFSATGGGTKFAEIDKVEEYLEKFKESPIGSATVHEAAFLESYPNPKEVWKVFERLFGK